MSKYDRRTFLKNAGRGSLAAAVAFSLPGSALLKAQENANRQNTNSDQNPPIPTNESKLRQIKAEPWMKFDDRNVFLKGMAFDRKNNLTVMAAYPGVDASKGLAGRVDRSIISISPNKKLTTLIEQHGVRLCDHVIHKDGRIFIACLSGELLVANGDGSDLKLVSAQWKNKAGALSDLTFDSKGNLYVTDFSGRPGTPAGAVLRWSTDFKSVEPFAPNLVSPNGVAFSPDGRSLWVACSLAKQLFHITLNETGETVKRAEAVYGLSGPGGDGIRTDVDGNVYLAMNFQGRILVFDKRGTPIATVLMPGRDRGELLSTTNMEFKPGTDEVYAVAAGDTGGTWVYKFKGLAKGSPLYSHQ